MITQFRLLITLMLMGLPVPAVAGSRVFTGYIFSGGDTPFKIAVRLFLIPHSEREDAISTGDPTHTALLKMSHGSHDSSENFTYQYHVYDWDEQQLSLDLVDYPNSGAISLPRFHLSRENGEAHWSGVVRSLASVYDLSVTLIEGWVPPTIDPKTTPLSEGLAGIYRAKDCHFSGLHPGLNTQIHRMHLLPNRASSDQMLSLAIGEAGMKTMNYLGVLTRKGINKNESTLETVTQELRSGRFNFYNQTLEINFQSHLLLCNRLDPSLATSPQTSPARLRDLWCRNSHFENSSCIFRYEKPLLDLQTSPKGPTSQTDVPDQIQSINLESDPTKVQTCDSLNGLWRGKSGIYKGAREMKSELFVRSISRDGECVVFADMKQHLVRSRPIVQRFAELKFKKGSNRVVLMPAEHSDAILELQWYADDPSSPALSGAWYSTLYGRVGFVFFEKKKSEIYARPIDNPVFALAGTYGHPAVGKELFDWETQFFNAGVDVNFLSADPSRMFSFAGMTQAHGEIPSVGGRPFQGRAVTMLPTRVMYLDYFSNEFLIKITNEKGHNRYLFGYTTESGFRATQISVLYSTLNGRVPAIEDYYLK